MNDLPEELPSLEALLRNDPVAWRHCFVRLNPLARKAARLQLWGYPEGDIEEIANEAMRKLVRHVQEKKTVERLEGWIQMFAERLAIDHYRKVHAQRRDRDLETSLEFLIEETGDSEVASISRTEI